MEAEPTRSYNRHSDCDKAEQELVEKYIGTGRIQSRLDISPLFHCHDDECEDCFGS